MTNELKTYMYKSRHISHQWHILHLPSTQPSLITQVFDQKSIIKLLCKLNIDKKTYKNIENLPQNVRG